MAPIPESTAGAVFIEIPLLVPWNCSHYSLPWTRTTSAHCLSKLEKWDPITSAAGPLLSNWRKALFCQTAWGTACHTAFPSLLSRRCAFLKRWPLSLSLFQSLSQSGQPSSKALLNFNLRWQNERTSTFGQKCMGHIHLMPGVFFFLPAWLACFIVHLNWQANLQQFSHKDFFFTQSDFLFW